MVYARNEKLNRLQRELPEGLVVDTAWLDREGYPKSLRDKYLASGWLEHVSRSLYRRPSAQLTETDTAQLEWERVVLSLQNLMGVGVSVGGRTALELQGFAHYLQAKGPREVHLYASEPLPGWLATVPVNAQWVVHKDDRLFDNGGRGLASVAVDLKTGAQQSYAALRGASEEMPWGHWKWPLTLSSPERAILELVDELPSRESFEQVDALMDGLGTLRPRLVQKLLVACQSVKVKRLFLFLAERHNHAWFKRLDRKRIDLGEGKRALVEHGRYDPNYRITVPAFLLKSGDGL